MTDSPEVWSSFTHDPREARYAVLRASDHDRAIVHQVLDEAYADGRLDREEYDERCARVDRSRVLGDFRAILGDLVAPPPSTERTLAHASQRDLEVLAERAWQTKRREASFSFLGASLVTTAIWFATCFGGGGFNPYFFWPGFVIAFSLLHLVRVAGSHREIVESEMKRLEKRRSKDQRGRGPFGPFGSLG
ncbi:DUF1707 domain-containing protein [Nocardioides sp. SR21]|uniref:DUF1707 SHOCT-like domain-containing protein n=1 Tax=Nocardioides sp. SR21 TaxID=2919501 RepID=UPI001FAA9B08|nr:DUF1707 domain-containing protein [Nocardioides sp. SR21]